MQRLRASGMATENLNSKHFSSNNGAIPFLVGFCFAFRVAIPILGIHLAGMELQAGSMLKLATGFLTFALVCFFSIGAPARPWRQLFQPRPVRWVLLFLCFSLCSFFWSETASLAASFAYWCGTAADVATILILLRTGNVADYAESLPKGFIYGACGIALVAWIMPAQADLRLGDEDILNANTICNVCVFAVFFFQYLIRRRNTKMVLAVIFLSITILRSLSKTTIAAFLISQAYLLIADRFMSRKTKLTLIFVAIFAALCFWSLFDAYYNVYTSTGNQAETLTGRTAIWTYIVSAAPDRPWLGHGFDSMWNVVPIFGTFEARHAENELLEQFYSYGVAGIILLGGVYSSLYRHIRKQADHSIRVIMTSIVLFVVVRGVAEAEPFDLLLPLWIVTFLSLLLQQEAIVSDVEGCCTPEGTLFPRISDVVALPVTHREA